MGQKDEKSVTVNELAEERLSDKVLKALIDVSLDATISMEGGRVTATGRVDVPARVVVSVVLIVLASYFKLVPDVPSFHRVLSALLGR